MPGTVSSMEYTVYTSLLVNMLFCMGVKFCLLLKEVEVEDV
jgi:hypothetical protein